MWCGAVRCGSVRFGAVGAVRSVRYGPPIIGYVRMRNHVRA